MTNIFGVHWISVHRGNIGPVTDRDVFARWNPGMVKIVCVDERVPYLEDVPPGALVDVRLHPMTELNDNRGGLGSDAPSAPEDYWTAISAQTQVYTGPDGLPYPIRPPLEVHVQRSLDDGWSSAVLLTPESVGQAHAATCNRMAAYCESKGVKSDRLIFEGLNEPQVWTAGESPALVARYYRAFLQGLHGYGLHGCVGNFGVGWPGNGGVAEAPVAWNFFKPVIDVFQPGDYLGLHEYWALNGPQQNWRWWAGRFLQCPFDVPILITECGIDTGVTGQWYGGWWDLPGESMNMKGMTYVRELMQYGQMCAADGRVKQVFTFSFDIGSSHWQKFNIRDWAFLDAFFAVQPDWPQVGAVIPPPPPPALFRDWLWDVAKEAQAQHGISLNPDAALQKRILATSSDPLAFTPLCNEFPATYNGIELMCQLAGRLSDPVERVYFCQVPKWDVVTFEEFKP